MREFAQEHRKRTKMHGEMFVHDVTC